MIIFISLQLSMQGLVYGAKRDFIINATLYALLSSYTIKCHVEQLNPTLFLIVSCLADVHPAMYKCVTLHLVDVQPVQ